ncbi:hypothetical protein ACIP93_32895 [Streptomyces sp. NPDC088745]|uniref:hypothetical protein n=1 Tax=Streptomyces sp. NPDC088745 TaxID=3365884 RepID=UPI0038024226
MTSDHDSLRTHFLAAVRAADLRAEEARSGVELAADERAHAILAAVEALPRGEGRPRVAEWLGRNVLQVDVALRRARQGSPARTLPVGAMDRILDDLRASLPPLPATHWQAVAHVVRGTVIDSTWLHDPAGLLADDIAEAGDDLGGIDTTALAKAVRGWSAGQTLAVIDACQQGSLAELPTQG